MNSKDITTGAIERLTRITEAENSFYHGMGWNDINRETPIPLH